MKLELDVKTVQFIMEVLGQLPTASGAYIPLIEIKRQADEQMKEVE